MRLIFSALAAIVIVAAVLFFFGPLLISTDEVRDKLLAQVEAATGYRLRVDGPVSFSLFPSLDLVAEDVGVAQSGSSGAEIATAKQLRFGLVWSALWGGKVQLTELTLVDPVIAMPARTAQTQAGGAEAAPAGSGASSLAATLQNLTLDKLVVKNGTVILPPSVNAPGKRIEQLMLEASLPSFDGPLSFDMKAVYEGNKVQSSGSIGNFGPFLGGTPSPVSLAVEAPAHLGDKVAFDGTAAYKDGALTLGQFTARTSDAVLTGSASYKDNLLTLHPFTAKAHGTTLSGSLAADLSGQVPAVNVALTADALDLSALVSKSDSRGAPGGGGAGSGGSGWSDAKIDFSPLKAVTAKLKLTAQQLIYNDIKISPVSLQATVTGGKLNAELPDFKLNNGAGAASLAVDASGQLPTQRLKLSLAGFDAYALLKDAAGFQNIEGTGAIELDVTASGASQHAMVQALNGAAKFDFTDGAIRGINVAKTVRSLTSGTLSGWQDSASEKTDFSTLGASFKVTGGQAQTDDLRLVGPLARMTGAGMVNLPARTLQFRVDPQIATSLEGQGGETDMQGLGVPVVIAGPWASPRIYPDIKGILENPVAAYEQLDRLGGGLVKLPSVDKLGGKVGATGVPALSNVIRDGRIDRDALQQGAIEGLGGLLNERTGPKPATIPDATSKPAAAPAKTKPEAVETKAKAKPTAVEPMAEPALEPMREPEAAPDAKQQPAADLGETEAGEEQGASDADAPEAAEQMLPDQLGN